MIAGSANPCGDFRRYKSRQLCQAFITSQEDIPMVRSFFAKEDGQGLVEYALILVLIAIVVIGVLSLLGGKVSTAFSTINSGLQTPELPGSTGRASPVFNTIKSGPSRVR